MGKMGLNEKETATIIPAADETLFYAARRVRGLHLFYR